MLNVNDDGVTKVSSNKLTDWLDGFISNFKKEILQKQAQKKEPEDIVQGKNHIKMAMGYADKIGFFKEGNSKKFGSKYFKVTTAGLGELIDDGSIWYIDDVDGQKCLIKEFDESENIVRRIKSQRLASKKTAEISGGDVKRTFQGKVMSAYTNLDKTFNAGETVELTEANQPSDFYYVGKYTIPKTYVEEANQQAPTTGTNAVAILKNQYNELKQARDFLKARYAYLVKNSETPEEKINQMLTQINELSQNLKSLGTQFEEIQKMTNTTQV